LANCALKARENEEILIGRSEEEYAAHIISLLTSREQAGKLTENAYAFILKNYNWDAIFEKVDELIGR
jgi:hypothetical protein